MDEDLKKLQGKWAVTALELDGAAIGAQSFDGASIVIQGSRFTSHGMGGEYGGTLELDARRSPKLLVMRFENGPEAGNANSGIYELKAGKWVICLSTHGGPAPESFSTSPGSGHALETLKRASKGLKQSSRAKAKPVTESSFPEPLRPVADLQGEWAMISCIRSGDPLPSPGVSYGRRRTTGIQTDLTFGKEVHMKGLICASEGAANWIAMHHLTGPSSGKTQLGIYKVSGDELRTCFGPPGGVRAAEYSSTSENRNTFVVWKRVDRDEAGF